MDFQAKGEGKIRTFVCVCPKCATEVRWQATEGSEREFMLIEYGKFTCKGCGETHSVGGNINYEKSSL